MKKLLRVTPNISWMPENSEGRLYSTDELPRLEVCRTAFAFAFQGEQMLFTRLLRRGWDIPGGHIDPGESPAQAAVRETVEEAGVLVEPLELIGVQELEVFGSLPRGGWTNPLSAQLFYFCRVVEMLPFRPPMKPPSAAFSLQNKPEPSPQWSTTICCMKLRLSVLENSFQ
jgi:8-oxo-dGTP diphosphatase